VRSGPLHSCYKKPDAQTRSRYLLGLRSGAGHHLTGGAGAFAAVYLSPPPRWWDEAATQASPAVSTLTAMGVSLGERRCSVASAGPPRAVTHGKGVKRRRCWDRGSCSRQYFASRSEIGWSFAAASARASSASLWISNHPGTDQGGKQGDDIGGSVTPKQPAARVQPTSSIRLQLLLTSSAMSSARTGSFVKFLGRHALHSSVVTPRCLPFRRVKQDACGPIRRCGLHAWTCVDMRGESSLFASSCRCSLADGASPPT
jgi:hypothetical protein